jgi:hypothetical protein
MKLLLVFYTKNNLVAPFVSDYILFSWYKIWYMRYNPRLGISQSA